MSTTIPTTQALKLLTRKEQRYVAARLNGDTMQQAARTAGLPAWMGRTRELADVEALVEEATAALAEIRFEECLIDAHEIHEYLTAAIRADWADIENDDGTFKPISEWPPIWRQMKEAGDVEVEYESHRSHDGEDRDGRGGWDSDGIVRKVKLKFTSRVKLIELAMKHKAVDAIVQPHTDVNLNVNITATEQRLERAKLRMQRVIDVKAKEIKE